MHIRWLSVVFLLAFLVPNICLGNELLFEDVPVSYPYHDAIEWAIQMGVLEGYPDGTFRPDKAVNRAELLKIVLEAKDVNVHSELNNSEFTDVDENAWYAPYIRYAKQQGIVQGYADNTFKPDKAVNFVEALKMAYITLNIETEETNEEWYVRYLRHALRNNILFTSDINLAEDMTRKDVVWIVWRLSQLNAGSTSHANSEALATRDVQSSIVQSGNLYPIHLLNNQQWKIRITEPVVHDIFNTQDVFEVSREYENFTVVAYSRDLKTGVLSKSTVDDYKVRFRKRHTAPQDDYLEVSRCWYKYKNIQAGFTCSYTRIPVRIEKRDVFGNQSFEGIITSASEEFEVEIVHKSREEVQCNVKGEIYNGVRIYHVHGTESFSSLNTGFRCFNNESQAKSADYKPSYK